MTITVNNLGVARSTRSITETESWRGIAAQRANARLLVDVHLHHHVTETGFYSTVDHGLTTTYRSLTITGTLLTDLGASRPHQPDRDVLDAMRPYGAGMGHPEWTALRLLWQRWHAQGLSPGCTHQTPPPRADVAEALAHCATPCPEDGYVFGSGWLVRDLPPDIVTRVRQVGAALEVSS